MPRMGLCTNEFTAKSGSCARSSLPRLNKLHSDEHDAPNTRLSRTGFVSGRVKCLIAPNTRQPTQPVRQIKGLMPELPEVETVVRDLRPVLCGRTIFAVRVGRKRLRQSWRNSWTR